ncbi:hypothetical protein [Bradyrhizobium elkanii]|uniref:hypothetical protein n=1 Tax=Bradyrhizobium elkanii TaxID=29448 RepID=UPI003517626A
MGAADIIREHTDAIRKQIAGGKSITKTLETYASDDTKLSALKAAWFRISGPPDGRASNKPDFTPATSSAEGESRFVSLLIDYKKARVSGGLNYVAERPSFVAHVLTAAKELGERPTLKLLREAGVKVTAKDFAEWLATQMKQATPNTVAQQGTPATTPSAAPVRQHVTRSQAEPSPHAETLEKPRPKPRGIVGDE